VLLVVMDRPGVALLPEPGEQGIEAWRGRLGRRCRGLHRWSLRHATPAATAGKAAHAVTSWSRWRPADISARADVPAAARLALPHLRRCFRPARDLPTMAHVMRNLWRN